MKKVVFIVEKTGTGFSASPNPLSHVFIGPYCHVSGWLLQFQG